MTKRRQTRAIAGCPQAPRPVAVLRESGTECIGTPCLRRRGRAGPSCRDGPQLSSPWCRPGGSCRPQAVREPWRCRATKAFAVPAARRDQAEAWNLTRKLKMVSSFQMSLPDEPNARARARKAYHSDGRAIHPKIEKQTYLPSKDAQSLHKSCRDPGEGRANLEVAICNLKLVIPTPSGAEGEGSAARRKMQIPHSVRDDKVCGIWRSGMVEEKGGVTARAAIAMRLL